ncbi:hypothetical protein BDZ90DRAFT_188756 [Jaminaea rosea]|uniref:Uncharacterized protein n=1 Tax=Jaminaea rosea TaxID=1569628 RepID=A0A316UPL0_9BASI|nr:hypothetical protein BDZ90DRAFT_188756 [Jaminaea rosea]PWN27236.1 hypothetical protein BDZ90DRAFT_188756 [Jaminaea rosea]
MEMIQCSSFVLVVARANCRCPLLVLRIAATAAAAATASHCRDVVLPTEPVAATTAPTHRAHTHHRRRRPSSTLPSIACESTNAQQAVAAAAMPATHLRILRRSRRCGQAHALQLVLQNALIVKWVLEPSARGLLLLKAAHRRRRTDTEERAAIGIAGWRELRA